MKGYVLVLIGCVAFAIIFTAVYANDKPYGVQLISKDFQRQRPIFLYDQRGYYHFDPLGVVRKTCERDGDKPKTVILEFGDMDVVQKGTIVCMNGAQTTYYLVGSK